MFKDTILGFVAGIQLSANNMLHEGDWIVAPAFDADGDPSGMSRHVPQHIHEQQRGHHAAHRAESGIVNIQLSANNMLHEGDWIVAPAFDADGDVVSIGLNTIKVRNWVRRSRPADRG